MTGEAITGDSITGEAASQSIGLNITVITGEVPILTILSPENKTYLSNNSILLDYSAINEDFVWYNLDIGNNITISSAIYFNTAEGTHTLYLYANNSYGIATKNITFTTNTTKFIIYYGIWQGITQGDTTDFIFYSYEDIQNLSGIILENTNYGKIQFNEPINLTADYDSSDNIIDLNTSLGITSNKIEINTSQIPNFNVNASLWIYNLSFTNPRILKNGVVCPETICIFESYSGGTIKFNVTEFSNYTIEEFTTEETPGGEIETPGGGGRTRRNKFEIDKEKIKISLKQGETSYEEFIIKNTGSSTFSFEISAFEIGEFIKISEEEFSLKPNEEKIIGLDFIARENSIPDLYIGKLIIKGGNLEKEIPIIIEIESKESLFDVKMEILRQFRYVNPGEEAIAQIEIYNLGDIDRVDVVMEYLIKDESTGEILIHEQDTIAVETQTILIKNLYIPEDTKEGPYIFYARANYEGKVASASAGFEVGERPLPFGRTMFILTITIIILIGVVIYLIFIRKKR
jgi:hypothetical protein